MPLEGFVCPDNEQVKLDQCLKQCRMPHRCLTLPSLTLMSAEREWKGTASTTQLLDGTMLQLLKITQPYYVDPQSRAFMIAGTKHHQALEAVAKELGLPAEIPLSVDRDVFDLIEYEGDEMTLTDYKLWGSFKVAKALGIVEVGQQPDPSGAVYKRAGKWGKAGDPKMIPVFQERADEANNWEAEFQLNRYRVMLKELGVTVHKLQLQVTVRDGGLAIAHSRGVFDKIRMIPVRLLPDDVITGYFKYKTDCLNQALSSMTWDMPCTPEECWEDMRCKSFCDVSEFCPKGRVMKEVS